MFLFLYLKKPKMAPIAIPVTTFQNRIFTISASGVNNDVLQITVSRYPKCQTPNNIVELI